MKNKFRILSTGLLCLGILLSGCGPRQGAAGLEFEDAWIRPLPNGMKMTAGFGLLRNPEQAEIEIQAIASPSFGEVSLHRTEVVDGISRMLEVTVLSVKADSELALEPGGYHLMLMMPSGEIKPGQPVLIEMTATDGRVFIFEVPVERR